MLFNENFHFLNGEIFYHVIVQNTIIIQCIEINHFTHIDIE